MYRDIHRSIYKSSWLYHEFVYSNRWYIHYFYINHTISFLIYTVCIIPYTLEIVQVIYS